MSFDDLTSRYPARFYSESGVAPVGGVLLTLGVSVVAGVVLAAVYSAVSFYNPFIYFGFIGTGLLGFAMGFVVNRVARVGGVRNATVRVGVALLVAVFAEYVSWAVFLRLLTDTWFLDPIAWLELVPMVAETGYYSIASVEVSGVLLWILWSVELLVVVGLAMLIAFPVNDVYCDAAGAWTTEAQDVARFQGDVEAVVSKLMTESYMDITSGLTPVPADTLPAIRVDDYVSPRADAPSYLTLHRVEPDEKGEESSSIIVEHVIVPPEVARAFRALEA